MEMLFECTNPSGAMPCIYDTRFVRDKKGKILYASGTGESGKVERRNRFVKRGKRVGYVDFASRKYFEPVDDEAKAQNKKDYAWLLKELEAKGITDIPEDATLSELGATYDKHDPRLAVAMLKVKKVKSRVFGVKKGKKSEIDKAEKESIKKELDALKVSYHPATGIDKLKTLLEKEKKKRAQSS
jgi:hypothetical protein